MSEQEGINQDQSCKKSSNFLQFSAQDFQIVSVQKQISPIKEEINEEQKYQETINFGWQRHKLGGEITYLQQFLNENPNLSQSDYQRLDIAITEEPQKYAQRKTTSGLMQNMALRIQSRISQTGEQISWNKEAEIQQAGFSDYVCKQGDYGKEWKGHQNSEWYQKKLECQQKNIIIMNIIKTALVLVLLILGYANGQAAGGDQSGKVFNCANAELVGLIGGDPMPIDSSKERYITFPGDVRFSHKTHKQTMDSLKAGKDYFGTNSIHYSSIQNGIYIFVIEKSQENIIQSFIKTTAKRTYKEAQIPQVFYLKTTIQGEKNYAIHQITMSDKKEMKRELFKEEKETMQSFTGLQFSKKFVNIVFATLETGTPSDFTADEDFLKGIKGVIDEVNNGKKCDQQFCPAPKLDDFASKLSDIPVLKIQCSKSQCTYSQGGQSKVLFTKIPFLQTGKNFKYLDKPLYGMLATSIQPQNQKFVSITAQLGIKCNIKDFDFHADGYSGAIQSVHLGDSKLYSVLIIEPGYNGIKRKLRTQTPELYDLLEGIEKVKNIYYYMIITKKGPEELFKETITIIEKIKADDKQKYACTPRPKNNEASFMQINSSFFGSKKQQVDENQNKKQIEQNDEDGYEYEYVYEYDYDNENGEGEYEYVYEYEYEEMPEELNQEQIYEEQDQQNTEQIEFDQSTEYSDSDSEDNQNIPQADLLELQKNEMCFQAYSDCNYRGASLKICGPAPTIPKELQNFLIKSIRMPDEMRITFYTNQQQKIVLDGNQECLQRPFEIDQMRPQTQLSHQ